MIGQKIKELRKSRKLTQVQLAKIIGLSQSSIGMIETGKQEVGRKTLVKFADFFGVTVDYLLSDETLADDKKEELNKESQIDTIAAHLEDKNLTPQKIKLLKNYIDALFEEEF